MLKSQMTLLFHSQPRSVFLSLAFIYVYNSKFAVGLLKRFLFDYFYHTYWSGEGFQKI
jgi:hypothetical protein